MMSRSRARATPAERGHDLRPDGDEPAPKEVRHDVETIELDEFGGRHDYRSPEVTTDAERESQTGCKTEPRHIGASGVVGGADD